MFHLKQIHQDILKAYGSLTEPTFWFVQAALEKQPYREIIARLGAMFAMDDEDTDPNYDVSFGLIIRPPGSLLVLRLSMVGPYAVLMCSSNSASHVVEPANTNTENERRILGLLHEYGIDALDRATLEEPVSLLLSDTSTENCRVFQALFTDTDILPWQHSH